MHHRATNGPALLSESQVDEFRSTGMLKLRSFYDVEADIQPIQRGIHSVIGLVISKYRLPIKQSPFTPAAFDSGYQELIAVDRQYGGVVYDAVKQLPAFMRLVTTARHEAIAAQLRDTDLPGIAAVGYGIRIDNPGDERFRAAWHQEYTGQLRSLDGIGFWIPLHPIDESMGAVEICPGSHKEGLFKIRDRDPRYPQKTGAYAQILDREEEIVSRFEKVTPSWETGDLLLLDFLVLHRSGFNRSSRARWSMQTRYFNFREPTGIKNGWCGSYASGKSLRDVHPEIFADDEVSDARV